MARDDLTPERWRTLLGSAADVSDVDGATVVRPRTPAALALALETASEAGSAARITGEGSWMPPDGPARVVLSTANLASVRDLAPADQVVTVGAGVPLDRLRTRLADDGLWVALDPPGTGNRTLGSVVATATSGPLQSGFGPVRDQLLGLTLVTGDGRRITVGGRVVKNVAGFDLTRLATGSFGQFGVITSVHVRLRPVPRADRTLVADGARDDLLATARRMLATGITPAALELLSPAAAQTRTWRLAVRLLGTDADVRSRESTLRGVSPPTLAEVPDAANWWREASARVLDAPVTIRLGTVPTGLETALDLVAHHLDEAVRDWIGVTVAAGALRWSGAARAEDLALLRRTAAEHEIPLTIERALWPLRSALGVYGAYREGVGRLVDRLRQTFDPRGVLA